MKKKKENKKENTKGFLGRKRERENGYQKTIK